MADAQGNGASPTVAQARSEPTLVPAPAQADALDLVAGMVPASLFKFSVGLTPGEYAQLDDVAVTRRTLPGQIREQIVGVVAKVEAVHERARFASDVFLIEQGALPAEVSEVAEVTVIRVEPELYAAPMPGARVISTAGGERESALYFDEMGDSKVLVGFGRDGKPVYVNFEFLNGTRGAHVSISGVPRIQTSFVMFLLHSIRNSNVLASEAHNTKALIFGVKSEDLLVLDHANSSLIAQQAERCTCQDYRGPPRAPLSILSLLSTANHQIIRVIRASFRMTGRVAACTWTGRLSASTLKACL